jgi:hypothetical protein
MTIGVGMVTVHKMDAQPPSLPPPVRPKNRPPDWFDRNWKWFVPLLGVMGFVLIGGFVIFLFGLMKSSGAYQGALSRVKTAPAVVAALGTPIKEGYFFTGNISVNGPSGRAELTIPISAPKGTATVYVAATKSLGVWHYDHLIVQIDASGQRIDISETKAEPGQPSTPAVANNVI